MASVSSPTSNSSAHMWTLRQRYKVDSRSLLGKGGTATVYKGLDTVDCKNVAVKIYDTPLGDAAGAEELKKCVHVFEAIHNDKVDVKTKATQNRRGSFDMGHLEVNAFEEELREQYAEMVAKDKKMIQESKESCPPYSSGDFFAHLDVRDCFVKLLDYSRTSTGEPGYDAEDESLYLIFEAGQKSLDDLLSERATKDASLDVHELRALQWSLISIAFGLHAAGYVHMDIKPQNVMRFKEGGRHQWKLIDLDGAVPAGECMELRKVTYTPVYMPPELAHAMMNPGSTKLTLSRLMDVWSVGMCALEAIFLQPVLQPFYRQWQEDTGGDIKFYTWLSKYDVDPIVSGDMLEHITTIDKDMGDLLGRMLAKDPAERWCVSRCLAHRFFKPVRDELMAAQLRELTGQRRRVSTVYNASFGAKACVSM